MQAGKPNLEELYVKWFNKTATPQQHAELIRLLESGVTKEELTPIIKKIWEHLQEDNSYSQRQKQQLADSILKQWPAQQEVAPRKHISFNRWSSAAAAAIWLLIGTICIWNLLIKKEPEIPKENNQVAKNTEVIQPGRNGAILTLADGRQVVLDSAANGVIGNQGTAQITLQNNQVIYKSGTASAMPKEMAYNTMATPKGRQFQLVLPDGSKVWLNAASSIRYPVAFNNKERKVEVSGEAYFEVAHDKAKPFLVQTKNQQVQALGTSFNVNAYADEAIEKTTLIEGSVKVNSISHKQPVTRQPLSAILMPGQQAKVDNNNQLLSIANNQSEAAIAWRNGYFNLENIPFDQMMKQLERWYDIQVEYENGVPDLHFVGGLSRNITLDALLRSLQVSEVHFKMETGRRLVVYK